MNDATGLDPRTPVLIGAGQAADPIEAADYHRWSAVDLAAEAARCAVEDAGLDAGLIDTVVGVRQFENSTPWADAPLGRSTNFPRSVAARLGADPARAVLEITGGQGPQRLVSEFARAIAAGEAGTVLVFGSEAISTTRAWGGRPDAPDFGEHVDGTLEDRGYGIDGMMTDYEVNAGLLSAPIQYALFENARRRRLGLGRAEYLRRIGDLFAPFTEVAAKNPYAAAPTPRSAEELMTVTERNRLVADPYPRFVVARDQVNQGAAVLLTSVGAARAAGVPPEQWVFLHGYADLRERPLLERADLSGSPAARRAAELALERAGLTVDDLDAFDLYSCFAVPVFNICDGLGLAPDDPRGLTLTGGLPFFGGAGNNYSMHAIAEAVAAVRERRGAHAFVGANGGLMSKYSVGIYSTAPAPFRAWSDAEPQAALDQVPAPGVTPAFSGTASVETYTVTTDPAHAWVGIVVGRLGDGTRTLAVTAPNDDDALGLLMSERPFDAPFTVTAGEHHNLASAFGSPDGVGG